VLSVEGLDPVKASINTAQYAFIDGEVFQAAQGGMRNIVLTLGYAPNYETQTVATLRRTLYGYFMPKSKVRLVFYSDHMPTVQITGYVESFDTPLFTKDPQVQISILCPQPHFDSLAVSQINGLTRTTGDSVINYDGTAECGFYLTLAASGSMNGFSVYNTQAVTEAFTMAMAITGQYVVLNTNDGEKSLRYGGATGTDNDIIRTVNPYSTWMKLKPGVNLFHVGNSASGCPDGFNWNLQWVSRFGGI